MTVGSGFTQDEIDTGFGALSEYERNIAAGSYSCNAQDTHSSSYWLAYAAAFKAGGGGSPVASVNSTGLATGLAAGTSTITAAVGSISGSATLTVASASSEPWKASSNNHYFVGPNNAPVLLMGDSPWSLDAQVAPTDWATYMSNRAGYGVNAILVAFNGQATNTSPENVGCTFDDICPFTSGTDWGGSSCTNYYQENTPNTPYYERLISLIQTAQTYGMTVFLDPIGTVELAENPYHGGFIQTMECNGTTKTFNYGKYLGTTFSSLPNIVWLVGNDFDCNYFGCDTTANTQLQALVSGIASTDTVHMITLEVLPIPDASLDDNGTGQSNVSLVPYLQADGDYTYSPEYDQVYRSYNRSGFKPAFLEESNYDGGHNCTTYTTTQIANVLRRQEYWTMTSGATGYLTGDDNWITFFPANWQSNLNTTAIKQFGYYAAFFQGLNWYSLVPDQTHAFLTSGYGTYQTSPVGSGMTYCQTTLSNNYATAALTSDGLTGVVYVPNSPTQSASTVTIKMSEFSATSVNARWFDPTTSNTYKSITGSPFPGGTGAPNQSFTTPGANSAGDPDWVLLLQGVQ